MQIPAEISILQNLFVLTLLGFRVLRCLGFGILRVFRVRGSRGLGF